MDFITAEVLNKLGMVGVLATIAVLVITDKLIWHTRLKKAEDRAERWEKVAIEALALGTQAGVKAAEVTADVVSALPDPARKD